MTLKDELDAIVKSATSDMGEIRGRLSDLEHALPHVHRWTADIRQIMMTLATRLTSIKVVAAKEVMIGNEEPATKQVRTEDLELFSARLSQLGHTTTSLKLLRASLHRAGDDSLDEVDDTEEGGQS